MNAPVDDRSLPPVVEQGAGIAVTDATVTYRNGHTALRDASFRIPTGTIAALVGVNGSGKSTLFKAIMGFVRLAKGDIRILGMTVHEALRRNRLALLKRLADRLGSVAAIEHLSA